MNKLQTITLKNFQSFEQAEVELSPGFTAVVGPSNLGKSALIRAIKALARNAPAPGLVREGIDQFIIEAKFSDGTVETLVKGKNKSIYEVDIPEVPGVLKHAKAGASSVPEEVAELWQLPQPDGRELAFTSQHDAPFLLAEPASAVAKVLGDLTNANVLMAAVGESNKRRTQALNDEKARVRESDEARDELLSHKGLSVRVKAVADAREAFSAATENVNHYEFLQDLTQKFFSQKSLIEIADEKLSRAGMSTQALTAARNAVDEVVKLEQLIAKAEEANSWLKTATNKMAHTTMAKSEIETRIHDLISDAGICPLCQQAVV